MRRTSDKTFPNRGEVLAPTKESSLVRRIKDDVSEHAYTNYLAKYLHACDVCVRATPTMRLLFPRNAHPFCMCVQR